LASGKLQDALPKTDELLQQAKCERRRHRRGVCAALSRDSAAISCAKDKPDQLPEVASVWASALALWREIGDEAYQVEALLGQAYCLWRVSPDRSETLVKEALALAKRRSEASVGVSTRFA
jgi:hypothetical protein